MVSHETHWIETPRIAYNLLNWGITLKKKKKRLDGKAKKRIKFKKKKKKGGEGVTLKNPDENTKKYVKSENLGEWQKNLDGNAKKSMNW